MRAKILGAGSAGLHLTNAACKLGYSVEVVDPDKDAIERFQSVFRERYGYWDAEQIRLAECSGPHDLVCIATPPETHLELALEQEDYGNLLIEKPLCLPSDLDHIGPLLDKKRVFVGYTHLFSASLNDFVADFHHVGQPQWLSVSWQEDISYINKAHPWAGKSYYMNHPEKGGTAALEHSHGLALWLHLNDLWGPLEGAVNQDLTTSPPLKRALLVGTKGKISWYVSKGRDFARELKHLETAGDDSPISLKNGLRVMRIIAECPSSQPSSWTWQTTTKAQLNVA